MTVNITVLGEAFPVPSSASDTNWAAQQVAFEQAVAAGVNEVATDLAELETSVTAPTWVQVTTGSMLNGWEAGSTCARSKSVAGVVTIQFNVLNGSPGQPCITLPSGWRPPIPLSLPVVQTNDGTPAMLTIGTSGDVTLVDVGASDVSTGCTILVSFSTTMT